MGLLLNLFFLQLLTHLSHLLLHPTCYYCRMSSPKSLAMSVREQRETQTVVREEIYKYAVSAARSVSPPPTGRTSPGPGEIKYTPSSYNVGMSASTGVAIPVPTQTTTLTTATIPYIAAPVGVVVYRPTYTVPATPYEPGSACSTCESCIFAKAKAEGTPSPWVYNY